MPRIDVDEFEGALPYASELYGIYRPLLGWRSGRVARRIQSGLDAGRARFMAGLLTELSPAYDVRGDDPREAQFRIFPATDRVAGSPLVADGVDSLVGRMTIEAIGPDQLDDPGAWRAETEPERLEERLDQLGDAIRFEVINRIAAARETRDYSTQQGDRLLHAVLSRESMAAGALARLHDTDDGRGLAALLQPPWRRSPAEAIHDRVWIGALLDPIEGMLSRAVVSPIGLVHLFRQYFFEFATFLGSPIEHLWLSPGGTVELIEESVRREVMERVVDETTGEVVLSEQTLTTSDELSDLVREQNSRNTRLGVSVDGSVSFGVKPVFNAQVDTRTSYDLTTSEEDARERFHRGARQQTEMVRTELTRSLRTTFKVTTETTDTSSRKYVIQNVGKDLVNYELRRKVRQVGIQVQDQGVHLCWQTYVDEPGEELGLSNLVHIAVPNDMPPRQHPEQAPIPSGYRGETRRVDFQWTLEPPSSPIGIGSVGLGTEFFRDVIAARYAVVAQPGYKLDKVEVVVVEGEKWGWQGRGEVPVPVATGQAETTATEVVVFHPPHPQEDGSTRQPKTDERPRFVLEVTPTFVPSAWLLQTVNDANAEKVKLANQEQERKYKEELFKAVRERVTQASKVEKRPAEDLRAEERIVVYRNLIRQLLGDGGIDDPAPAVHHAFAEVVQSIFDVDRMLYFVAPEWWTPQSLPSQQHVFRPIPEMPSLQQEFVDHATVSWGGARASRRNNYLITDDSEPAPLGSSLGWVIQLDGDDLRNAFLNAPWVKAVIPVREGRERQAIEWLSAAEVEGTEGLDKPFKPDDETELDRTREELGLPPGADVSLRQAIERLVQDVERRHAAKRDREPGPGGGSDEVLVTDAVYEHGFRPLQGGFRAKPLEAFEVFDQWIEIVPTRQIVPVEVEYDPETGLQT
jgi:hypothetical protein